MPRIKLNNETEKIKRQVDHMYNDSLNMTDTVNELLVMAPEILRSHENFRTILRHVKRTGNLQEALEIYAVDCCPPISKVNNMESYCGITKCTDCWKNFCKKYLEAVKKKEAEDK